jgi:hypothetical protein
LWLDTSVQAKRSVILRGVGGDSAKIGGRGPMVVRGKGYRRERDLAL